MRVLTSEELCLLRWSLASQMDSLRSSIIYAKSMAKHTSEGLDKHAVFSQMTLDDLKKLSDLFEAVPTVTLT